MEMSSAPDIRRRPHRVHLGTRRQAIWETASFFQEGQIGYGKKFLNI
jgi:hypothetical protein